MEESLLNPPIEIDHVVFLQVLGRGGMSTVYKARQSDLDRLVAIKVLDRTSFGEEQSLLRFREEAKITSQFDHPNIVKTLGFGIASQGNPYLTMEYIDGTSLSEKLKECQRLKLVEFQDIFLPILSALAEAEKIGLVHRDIKPGNIMIVKREDGSFLPKLVDFGIAKILQEDQKTNYTRTGALLGTPNYMSPEQCQGKALDGRSDIYSLACVMYEALSGDPPFTANSALEVMHMHSTAPAPSRSDLTAKIQLDRELAELVASALAKDPQRRPQNAEQFRQQLQKALSHLTLEKLPTRKKQKAEKQTQTPAAIMFVCLLTVISVLFFVLWKRENSQTHPLSDLEFPGSKNGQSIGTLRVQAVKFEKLLDYENALLSYQELIAIQGKRTSAYKELAKSLLQAARCIEKLVHKDERGNYSKHDIDLLELAKEYTKKVREIGEEHKDKQLYYDAVLTEIDSLTRLADVDLLSQRAGEAVKHLGRCKVQTFDVQTKIARNLAFNNSIANAKAIAADIDSCHDKESFTGLSNLGTKAIIAAKESKKKEVLLLINEMTNDLESPNCTILIKGRVQLFQYSIQPALIDISERKLLISLLQRELRRPDYQRVHESGSALSHTLAEQYLALDNAKQAIHYEDQAVKHEEHYLYTVDMIGKYRGLINRFSGLGPAYANAVKNYRNELHKLEQQQENPNVYKMYNFEQ